jgi:hypothetical protein
MHTYSICMINESILKDIQASVHVGLRYMYHIHMHIHTYVSISYIHMQYTYNRQTHTRISTPKTYIRDIHIPFSKVSNLADLKIYVKTSRTYIRMHTHTHTYALLHILTGNVFSLPNASNLVSKYA